MLFPRGSLAATCLVAALLAVPSCNQSTVSPEDASADPGYLQVWLTDAPATYENVWVTMDRLSVHRSGGPWQKVDLARTNKDTNQDGVDDLIANPDGSLTVDLLALRGVETLMATGTVDAGHYTQLRLRVVSAEAVESGAPVPLEVPSGGRTGIKLVGGFDVNPGETVSILLDFDAEESIVERGDSGEPPILKPVIRLTLGGGGGITHPVVAGPSCYRDTDGSGSVDPGDEIVVTFDQAVRVNGASASDLVLPVAGDTFGTGATVLAGPGPAEVTVVLGVGASLKSRQTFDPSLVNPNHPSGIDVSATMTPDAIEGAVSGLDAAPSTPADLVPELIDLSSSLGSGAASSLQVCDLDRDGDLDAIVTYTTAAGSEIWLNDGSGMFTNSGQALGSGPVHASVLGDFDRDGDTDLATAAGGIRIWSNDGAGNLTAAAGPLGSSDTRALGCADLDRDGDLDLVAGNAGGQGNMVWWGDGAGGFSDSGQGMGSGDTLAIALGDVDRDGDPDIVAGNDGGPNLVWWNDGAGTFTDSGQALGQEPTHVVALGDVDGDGDLDLFSGEGSATPDSLWQNDGNGLFQPWMTLGATSTSGISILDYDADGDEDLILGGRGGDLGGIWRLEGGQVLPPSPRLRLDGGVIATGDLDGDGDADLLLDTGATIAVLENSLSGTRGESAMVASGPTPVSTGAYQVAIGDVNRDGAPDIVLGRALSANHVWLNDGAGNFTDSGAHFGAAETWGLALGDLDRDGDLDVVTGNRTSFANRVFFNDGTGIFLSSGQALGSTRDTIYVCLGDFDRDGDEDVYFANWISLVGARREDEIWWNDGAGFFTNSGQQLGIEGTASAEVADIDRDGDLDIVATPDWNWPYMKIWLNDGAGTFTPSGQVFPVPNRFNDLAFGDLDRDGDLDIVAGGNYARILTNDGTGWFQLDPQVLPGDFYTVAVYDAEGDGDLDFYGGRLWNDPDDVFVNDGTGVFSAEGFSLGSYKTYSVAPADLDRDGDIDVVSGNAIFEPTRIWLNE